MSTFHSEMTRIENAKASLKTAINGRGGTLTTEHLENYADAVAALPSGGVDVSSTTAEASDVLNGKLFYNAGGLLTGGTIMTSALPAPVIAAASDSAIVTATCTTGGGYLVASGTQTATLDLTSVDSRLTAANIASGVSIFGVSGTLTSGADVSDTTATAGDVLSGKCFYTAAGVRSSGTIPAVTQPAPEISLDSSTGVVTASYTPAGGFTEDQTGRSATLRLAVQGAQTITPTTSAQTVAAGKFLTGAQTIAGDANLVGSNIASGVSIFGVTGTHVGGIDVSDTTAAAGDVLSGKYFYTAAGVRSSGTIPAVTQPAPEVSLNASTGLITASYTPASGFTEEQTIKSTTLQLGTGNIPTLRAANIRKNVNILGVTGSCEGGAGTVNIYRCVSASNGSWSGCLYDAVMKTTASTVTEGLTYAGAVAPTAGKYYTEDGLIQCELYASDGLVFYAPLHSAQSTAETGQPLTATGTVDYSSGYALFDSSYLSFSDSGFPTGSAARTISMLVRKTSGSGWQHAFGYGSNSMNAKFYLGVNDNGCACTQYGSEANSYVSASGWTHFLVTQDSSGQIMYIDGEQNATAALTVNTILHAGYIGAGVGLSSSEMFHGYVSECKLWNRILSQAEITAEYNRLHAMVTA